MTTRDLVPNGVGLWPFPCYGKIRGFLQWRFLDTVNVDVASSFVYNESHDRCYFNAELGTNF